MNAPKICSSLAVRGAFFVFKYKFGRIEIAIDALLKDSQLGVGASADDLKNSETSISYEHGKSKEDVLGNKEIQKPPIAIPLFPRSIPAILFKILKEKFPNHKLGIIKQFDSGDGNLYVMVNDNTLFINILESPYCIVLGMNDNDIDIPRQLGEEMESKGQLKRGTTEKSYVRFLERSIESMKSGRNAFDKGLMERYESELREARIRGFKPLTDEELVDILKGVVDEILGK